MQTQPRANAQQKVILDILVGNDWRHLHVTLKVARRYIQTWPHRGFTITSIPIE